MSPAPADRASHLSGVLTRLGGGEGRTPDPGADHPATTAELAAIPPWSGTKFPSYAGKGLKLPYPAAVYRAAAKLLADSDAPGLTICVADGPHVPGDECPVVKIEDLLRGVADAIDPPVIPVPVSAAEARAMEDT